MAQTIIANLPTTSEINPSSYVIIERPGIGKGTYKSTVGDLQDAITVHAKVEQENDVTTITVSDINGTTQETIVTPTATITDNGDNTATITITDTHGVTTDTVVSKVIFDPEPTEGSVNHMISSDTVWRLETATDERIAEAEERIRSLENREDGAEDRLTAIEDRLNRLEQRMFAVEEVSELAVVVESDNILPNPFKTADGVYDNLKDAMLAASASESKFVKLLSDGTSPGISIPSGTEVTVDLGGHTLNVTGPGEGSPGTKTLGMQLLKGSTITFQNGTIIFNDSRLKMGIQNYCNLTLDNIQVSGGPTILYVVSDNFGHIKFRNHTTITASAGRVAFDVWYGLSPDYYAGVDVTIEDETVTINGKVEFGKQRGAPGYDFAMNAFLKYPIDMPINLDILTKPCVYIDDHEAGTRTVRYMYLVTNDETWLTEINEAIMTQDEYDVLVPVKKQVDYPV